MKHLLTLLMLAVCFGLNLNAQQLESPTQSSRSISREASLTREKTGQKSDNLQIQQRIREKQKNPLQETTEATITFQVIGNPWGDGTGFQMLLDSRHTMLQQVAVMTDYYNYADYTIPIGATDDFENPVMLLNDQKSINVPAGVYDFVFMILDVNEQGIFLAKGNWGNLGAYAEDFPIKGGYEYDFIVQYQSNVEFHPAVDASMDNWVGPVSSSNLTNSEPVSVRFSNVGTQPISSVQLSYRINEGPVVTETCSEAVRPDDSFTYTFNTKANFSAKGIYDLTAWLTYDADINPYNDQVTRRIKHSPLSLPFIAKFDNTSEVDLLWSIEDANGDGITWHHFDAEDVDGGSGFMSISAPITGSQSNDYLVSEALVFPSAGDYHISFHAKSEYFGVLNQKESFRILYGTSSKPESMSVLADYPVFDLFDEWIFVVKNFEITTPGAYYFAFQYYSDNTGRVLHVDNITVDADKYEGFPDIAVRKVEIPASACSLSSESPVTVTLTNVGTDIIDMYFITTMLDGELPGVSQFFYDAPIEVMQSVTITLDRKLDLSATGEHSLRVFSSVPGDSNTDNNELTVFTTHYEPLTTLPFESDFSVQNNRKNWNSTSAGAWVAGGEMYTAAVTNEALFSRCITLSEGAYNLSVSYSGGFQLATFLYSNDFYIAYGKAGTDPLSWEPVKEFKDVCTNYTVVTTEMPLRISEAGDYSIAIVSTKINTSYVLSIYKVLLSGLPDHDIHIVKADPPVSFVRQTPKHQVPGEKQFMVTVGNKGMSAETARVEIKLDNEVIGSNTVSLAAIDGKEKVPVTATLPSLPEGPFTLQILASIDNHTDANPADNMLEMTKYISDSTFVLDVADENYIGVMMDFVSTLGLVYTLDKSDILTSINVALTYQEDGNDFGIAVYPCLENGDVGEPVFTQVQSRPVGGSSITFDVPDTQLEAGAYLFAVQQLTVTSLGIGCDYPSAGGFYFLANNKLSYFTALGHVHIRPNFGKYGQVAVPVVRTETQVSLYPNPVSDVLTVSAAGQTIEQLSISDITGKTVYRTNQVNASSYTMNVNQLPSGIYFVSVQTALGVTASKLVVK